MGRGLGDKRRSRASRLVRGPIVIVSMLAVAPSAAQESSFDHDLTGFPLTGAHEAVRCDACHAGGTFAGTPIRCADCHEGTGLRAATGATADHIRTTAACADCHTTRRWTQVRMDHAVVSERCESCHFGAVAGGKPANHIASSNRCGDCHGTRRWEDATFDHDSIVGSCTGCHNGVTAMGKSGDHVATVAECDVCHSTRRWIPASFDHSEITGSCSGCHDGVKATGEGGGHFVASAECASCHRTSGWLPDIHRHVGPYPGDHRRSLDCRDCHGGNSEAVTWRSPSYQPDCAGCHAGDYRSGPHKKHENPDARYTVGELRDCSGSCHIYTDPSLTTIKKRRDREHRVSDNDFD